jgi:vacuolar-type H+-ATPase subunit E/Vma4
VTEHEQQTTAGADGELIRGILAEAQAEADKLVADAESSAADRRLALERRLKAISRLADESIETQRKRIVDRTDAAIELIKRRSALRIEHRVFRDAERRATEELAAVREQPGYAQMIRAWTVEAALGLGEEMAVVRCPEADAGVVEQSLAAASKELEQRHGLSVRLRFSEDRLPSGQGVVLAGSSGTVAFSNTATARMRRFAPEIGRIVYHTVIEPEDTRG